ncbi:glycoside hydrolase family 5 protein [Ilyomonas limi]|uniref:Glycoside hydrolase family 5 protein n=1 Tax=Ilyomonas limi TaxID=2575867 RepID=A0A4U3L897_9BACT|nr:cellulase family glycosylhydrolase [Ilyomonas limi]TKK71535.1 glycoside hydrolase family 5 protein [Ilyomonas limi]
MKILLSVILLCAFCIASSAQKSRFFSTSGKNILDPNGQPFLIKGTNLGNWLVPEGYMFGFTNTNSPRLISEAFNELIGPGATADFWKRYLNVYVTKEDIHYLRSLGMNSLRVPFNYRLFTNENYMGAMNENHGFQLLDSLVEWCRAENIYLILDMHAAPGGQTGDNIDDSYGYPFLFDDTASQNQAISIWQRIAAHYSNEPIIIGYDLLNEPIATYFDSAHFNPLLEPLYKRIANAIRQVDKNHILFLGGAQWDSNFNPFNQPFDDKAVYTFHKYWTAPTKAIIQQYLDFRDTYNVPIYIGETGENTDGWIDSFRVVLEKENIGWHFWPYKKLDNTRCIVTFEEPAMYDSVIAYTKKDRSSFEKIRQAQPKDRAAIQQALNDFLINCQFKNCKPNEGYIKALGFKVE